MHWRAVSHFLGGQDAAVRAKCSEKMCSAGPPRGRPGSPPDGSFCGSFVHPIGTPSLAAVMRMKEAKMKNLSLALLIGITFLLFSAAVIANIDGVPVEMRGAWLAKRF